MALTSGSCNVQLQAFEWGKHRIKISVKWKQTTWNKRTRIKNNSACLSPSHLLPLRHRRACTWRGYEPQTILIPESLLNITERNAAEYHRMHCAVVCNGTTLIGWLATWLPWWDFFHVFTDLYSKSSFSRYRCRCAFWSWSYWCFL